MTSLTSLIIGLDEVGRGALAGPLVVGAVGMQESPKKLTPDLLEVSRITQLRDSKKLTALQRERVFSYCQQKIIWGIGEVEAAEIDYFGLTGAVSLAAERALASLKKQGFLPKEILADAGLHHPFEKTIPTEHFVKGDENILEITLASIMAKVWRDRHMVGLSEKYPHYGWETNVGYGSKKHLDALSSLGPTPEHRQLFLRKFRTQKNMV